MPDTIMPDELRITAVSDLHGHLPRIDPCDLLLLGGDLCPVTDHSIPTQARFLAGPFADWLSDVPALKIVGIAGNHDFIFQQEPDRVPAGLRWTYLQDSSVEIAGLHIYGTPWQPWFGDWAFNAREPELIRHWAKIPDATDVLIVHGPPRGYGDLTITGNSTGSPALLDAIDRVRPKLALFGHIHEGRGLWTRGPTTLANVSYLNARYKAVHTPLKLVLRRGRFVVDK